MSSEEQPDRPADQTGEVDLTPHPLVPGLERDQTHADEGLTTLVGFIGPARTDDRVRVYLDLSFASYCDVAKADIVQTAPVDANDENSPSTVWVNSSAQMRLVSVGRLTGDASFVTGAIRSRHFRRGARYASANRPNTEFPCTIFFICDPKPLPPRPGSNWECLPSDDCTTPDFWCQPSMVC